MTSRWPAIFLCLWGLLSCGPHRHLIVHNQSGEPASLTWFIKEDSIHSSPVYLSNTLESAVHLSGEAGTKIRLSAGTGLWTPTAVTAFADDLDSMRIQWGKQSLLLTSPDSIRSFLISRRRGLAKDRIHIILQPDPASTAGR